MKLTQYISLLLLTGAAASVVSCTEMDDYLRFTEGVSSTYTGKLDSAVFLAGNGRLLFHGELSSDPKVSRIGLYWNVGTKQDSLSIEVDYAKDKIVEQEIALGEGSYNFQIYTYDSAGNHSIPMTRSGNSYGANYLEGLYNRVVKSCALDGEDIAIEWYSGSENSPYTVVTYTGANGKPVEVQVGPKEEQTRLPQVREPLELVRHADVFLYGVGRAMELAQRRGLSASERDRLAQEGAVAEALGFYINAQGRVVGGGSSLAIRPEDIGRKNRAAAVAAGRAKAEAILAVCAHHPHKLLVADEGAALRMMELLRA